MSEDFNHWNEMADAFNAAIDQVIRKTAFDILAGYQSRVSVDTGFCKNSAYVSTDEESTYGGASPTKKDSYLLPEEKPEGPHEAIIGVGANYGLFLEMGTAHRRASPALIPAVDAARPGFEAAMSKIEDKLQSLGG